MAHKGNNAGKEFPDEDKIVRRRDTPRPKIDAHIQKHLGGQLKQLYQSLVEDLVPDKFIRLLTELEEKEKKGE